MPDRVLTPSTITAWLDCPAYLGLKHQVDDGLMARPHGGVGSFARLIAEKGMTHERQCLAEYERQGLRVVRAPVQVPGELFDDWADRTAPVVVGQDWDVLYQVPLVHGGIRGVADFLRRVVAPDGRVSVEPVDAKLARQEAKPGHVLQLCFYAEAVEELLGAAPQSMYLWLGSGQVESLRVEDFRAYWTRLRSRLTRELSVEPAPVPPEPCAHCGFCEFSAVCDQAWREADSLVYVAGLRAADRRSLEVAGVQRLADLAVLTDPVVDVPSDRLLRITDQARLQEQARGLATGQRPPHQLITPGADPVWGRGLDQLPEPDEGDVVLDFEGHPFWRPDTGLFFLLGLIERDDTGAWAYRAWWAHDQAGERRAVRDLVDHLADRRARFPGMHVLHYNHTERSSLERLAAQHGVAEVTLAELVNTGAFVDLFPVARNALQAGVESYGLKHLEQLTGFQRSHDIDAGAGAVVAYERWMVGRDEAELLAIARYNEDDVRATLALRDWLVEQRDLALPWRAPVLSPPDGLPDLDARIEDLHAFGAGTPEHLLGDVLGYWRREWQAYLAPRLAACAADTADALEDPTVVTGLQQVGEVPRLGKNGRPVSPLMTFTFPPQDVSEVGKAVLYSGSDHIIGYASVHRVDGDAGELELVWTDACKDLGLVPQVVTDHDYVHPKPKPAALDELAAAVLDPGTAPWPAAMALLRRDRPRFIPGQGPAGGTFTDDLPDMVRWTTGMDRTCVGVQGPPGTGKTYRGARQIRALLEAGLRVGITSFSHHAIDNLLGAVVELYTQVAPGALRVVQKVTSVPARPLAGVTYATGNKKAATGPFDLVAGTTWLFAGDDMAGAPVDVLVVDEAGQLSLADTLAATRSARNLLLLGDPMQLPQVSQAVHSGGSGDSALQHLLGEETTMPADWGVFLTETHRMHPDVCAFISDTIYRGRLTSHADCAQQTTAAGTGLRWLRAEHGGRSTAAPEEVELVRVELLRLIGTRWVDQHGQGQALTVRDVMVVAPYNDQVALLRAALDADPRTTGIPVGTVDKFQGREAAVVLFTMTTSNAEHMPRGADFLFSRNRLNVAISRARCLAYLVCTEELLDSRGRDVEEMRLISTLCAFAEASQEPTS